MSLMRLTTLRLNTRIILGAIALAALSLPAAALPLPKLHNPFHRSQKDPETDVPATEKAKPEPKHRHTNGFPEADKKDAKFQPQNEKQWWGDSAWKTPRNEETWKQAQTK